jgi:hypothetical protein
MNKCIIYISGVLFCLIVGPASGQSTDADVNGIYLTENDFRSEKLSEVAPSSKNDFIAAELGTLKVYRNGIQKKYRFGEVFGYYQNGIKYRAYRRHLFFDRPAYYKVVDDSALIVYSNKSTGHKGPHYTYYYYSVNAGSPIIRISSRTIAKSFESNPDFVDQVNKAIRNKTVVQQDSTGVTELNKLFNTLADKYFF